MRILGLHMNTGQTAASLLIDGQICYAAAEERFDRIKRSRAFPRKSIEFCLGEAGLKDIDELDGIAVSWNPAENMRHINLSGFTTWRRYDPEWLYIVPNNIMSMTGDQAFDGKALKMELATDSKCPLYFVDHHHAHLAHAICQSPFERGMAMAIDEYGEFSSVTIARFSANSLEIVKEIPYPNSLGVFYAAFTEYLGFAPNADEWKVMGAAAYGDPSRFSDRLERIIEWDCDNGEWVLDTRYIEHSNMKRAGYINERLQKYLGLPVRNKNDELTQVHFDLAASVQAISEKRMFQIITFYSKLCQERNLAASGGCFMNSLANGKIITQTPVEKIFVPYAAADNGGAMGSALYMWCYGLKNTRKVSVTFPSPYLGPEFSNREIEEMLIKYKIEHRRVENITGYTAEKIAQGRLVGWFQGRMEFGERALGNRSILVDPRNAEMKDKINSAVKYREAFRPFAPSVLEEKVSEYFDIPEGACVPYMEQVYPIKESKRRIIPAVVHADGTGRLQTVLKETNPLYYELILEFERITGVPVILNTSFNVQGEPIVCTPTDAIKTFYTCGLDILVLGNCVLEKNDGQGQGGG